MKAKFFCVLATLALLASLAVAKGKDVTLTGVVIDKACSARMKDDESAAKHKRGCSLMEKCKASGLGLYSGGKFYDFDASGTEQAVKLLEASSSDTAVKVTVTGSLEENTITVKSIKEAN